MKSANPKKGFGVTKPQPHLISPVAIIAETFAAELGASKYGPYNWRDKPVDATTYLDAIDRHKILWMLGEDNDPDTGVSHLGNIRMCCAILLDAMATGNFIDDRPKNPAPLAEVKRLFALKESQIGKRRPQSPNLSRQIRTGFAQACYARLRGCFMRLRGCDRS